MIDRPGTVTQGVLGPVGTDKWGLLSSTRGRTNTWGEIDLDLEEPPKRLLSKTSTLVHSFYSSVSRRSYYTPESMTVGSVSSPK